MKLVHIGFRVSVLATVLFLAGCASIMSGRHAEVSIDSYPSNAHVVVRDRRGQQVASVNTPGKVTLKRKERIIFPARYTASIEAPGYQGAEVPIRSTVNPWVLGNVVLGGIPGLIVDNATGAAWKPRESTIYRQLTPIYTAQQGQPPASNSAPKMAAVPQVPSAPQSDAPARTGEPLGTY
jgi:hypothetical protein